MNIVLCTDNNYAMPCGVTITSVIENNKDSFITFHIVGMDLSEEVKATLLSISSVYNNVSVLFHELKKDFIESYNFSTYDSNYMSLATYVRLFFEKILPSEVDKIIYLDCDMIVRGSLADLWNVNIDNYSIAGVEDLYASKPEVDSFNRLGYDEAYQYFNAGMVLINLKYWREHGMNKVFLDFFKNIDGKLLFYDQDILNGALYSSKLILPFKYNVLEYYYLRKTNLSDNKKEVYSAMEDPIIVHYTGVDKPWIKSCLHPLKDEFFKYKSISLWKDTPLSWGKRPLSNKIKYYKRIVLYTLKLKKRKYITVKKDAASGKYILNR